MMSACCSKHVEAWNKHIEKECIKLVIIPNICDVDKDAIIFGYCAVSSGEPSQYISKKGRALIFKTN